MTKPIKFLFALIAFFTLSKFSLAQKINSDSLYCERKLFTSKVYLHGNQIFKYQFAEMLKTSKKWSRKNTISRIILPIGPLVAAGGIYLAYDAIKGIPMEAEIDGVIYPYTKRNLPELLGGLAFFVTGLSMVESSNETTQNAVNWYNSQLKPDKISMNLQLGLNQKGHLALRLNF